MVSYALTEEQSAIRRLARDFAREYILPRAGYLHSDGANQVHRIKLAQLFTGLRPAH